MHRTRNIFLIFLLAITLAWALTAPGWFARSALGHAMTDLDIWAQIHIPYPVLSLLLVGFAITCGTLWLRRRLADENDPPGIWNGRH